MRRIHPHQQFEDDTHQHYKRTKKHVEPPEQELDTSSSEEDKADKVGFLHYLKVRRKVRVLLLSVIIGLASFTGLAVYISYANRSFVDYDPGNIECNLKNIDFSADINRRWFLLGDEFSDQDPVRFSINLDKSVTPCDLSSLNVIFSTQEEELVAQTLEQEITQVELDPQNYKPGEHQVSATITDQFENKQALNRSFDISHPVYVAWTLDWEGYNFSDEYWNSINSLSNREDTKVPITHFFNPRYFLGTIMGDSRAQQFKQWVQGRKESHGDEIGLHIHMFYDLVAAAGVEPRREPTWNNRSNGSDVPMTAYTYEEQKQVIQFSLNVLREQGIKDINSFRAGGWFADQDTMRALDELGFEIESSGRTYYSLGNGLFGPWALDPAEQPYFMCRSNINDKCSNSDAFGLLQMPNNGGESYRFDTPGLIDRFNGVYSGGHATEPKIVNYLSHPEWFYIDQPKISTLFDFIDKKLYDSDSGPVIYTTLSAAKQRWE